MGDDALGIFEHFGVPEADDFESCSPKMPGALGIVGSLGGLIVMSAVNLDYQSSFEGAEVSEIRPNRIFAAEFNSELSIAHSTP